MEVLTKSTFIYSYNFNEEDEPEVKSFWAKLEINANVRSLADTLHRICLKIHDSISTDIANILREPLEPQTTKVTSEVCFPP